MPRRPVGAAGRVVSASRSRASRPARRRRPRAAASTSSGSAQMATSLEGARGGLSGGRRGLLVAAEAVAEDAAAQCGSADAIAVPSAAAARSAPIEAEASASLPCRAASPSAPYGATAARRSPPMTLSTSAIERRGTREVAGQQVRCARRTRWSGSCASAPASRTSWRWRAAVATHALVVPQVVAAVASQPERSGRPRRGCSAKRSQRSLQRRSRWRRVPR